MLTDVYAGNPPNRELFKATTRQLIGAVYSGYGKDLRSVNYNTRDFAMLNELTYNVGVFSAFKKHNQVRDTVKLLKNADGSLRARKDFIAEALKLDSAYNKRYLVAEYNSALQSARMARKWQDAERTSDLYPNLTYIAVNDDRTRQTHKEWHGITLPINHQFWKTHYPPNDWGCRCSIRRTDKPITDNGLDVDDMANLPKQFNINVGLDGKVFNEDHPYFKVPQFKKVAHQAQNAINAFKANEMIAYTRSLNIFKRNGLGKVLVNKSSVNKIRNMDKNDFFKVVNLLYDFKSILKQLKLADVLEPANDPTNPRKLQVEGYRSGYLTIDEVDYEFVFEKDKTLENADYKLYQIKKSNP